MAWIFRLAIGLAFLNPLYSEACTPGVGEAAGEGSAALPQVRLRKLHLVRPDLIPYPLSIEVIC